MVRILEVKQLEAQKRLLLTRSEIYRQTLRLETANLKFSVALLQRRFNSLKSLGLGLAAAPLAGLFLRKRSGPKPRSGLLSKVLSGIRLFRQASPLVAAGLAAAQRSHNGETNGKTD